MKRTPISPVSKRRRKQLSDYTKIRKEYLIQNKICGLCKKSDATDIHHVAGRWKDRLNDTKKWQPLCRGCHDYIHRNPTWAYANGWLEKR